jgi:hypothetical protein
MIKRGLWAGTLVILLVLSAGCTALFSGDKDAGKTPGQKSSESDLPEIPAEYQAHSPVAENAGMPAGIMTPEIRKKPILQSAAQIHINGTGLSGNESSEDLQINKTTEIISQANWRDVQAAIVKNAVDSANPVTSGFASQWLRHGTGFSFDNVCDMYNPVMDWTNESEQLYAIHSNWTYIEDIQQFGVSEYWAPASQTIKNGLKGDCDDFAILNSAMTQSIGGETRLAYAISPSTNGTYCVGHMYAEVNVPDTGFISIVKNRYFFTSVLGYHEDSAGYWVALDWFPDAGNYQHPGASLYDNTRGLTFFYPNGTWSMIRENDPACTAQTQI